VLVLSKSVLTNTGALSCACLQVVGGRALSMLDQFKEQELSNVVWAFAKLHHCKSDMFGRLLQAVANKLPHFLPQVGWCAGVSFLQSVHLPAQHTVLRTWEQSCHSTHAP
jgi:hypothetical protein